MGLFPCERVAMVLQRGGQFKRQGTGFQRRLRMNLQGVVRNGQRKIDALVAKRVALTPTLGRVWQGAEHMGEAGLAGRIDRLEVCHMLRGDHGGAVAVEGFVCDAKFHKHPT